MIVVQCQQGSEEWHQARCGAITASMFATARSRLKTGPSKGDFTAAAKDYAFRVAVERISGEPLDEGFETWQMQRGHELEPEARMEHELQSGLIITRAGYVSTDDGRFGGSADGLIGEDGGSEYKCLVSPTRLRQVLVGDDLSEFIDQVQGCLWLTGRKFWHFCLFCPALAPIGKQLYWREIRRDDAYIEALEGDLVGFEALVSDYERRLRADRPVLAEAA
ncbi:MAG: YqaJ viral recombinase family protein [Steroidobacteraceae bacterium]|nr:YqaJ viral recombinase family protein [Steroidobacteraceae bacterium]